MKLIPNVPALLLKNKVVIADVHLGLVSFFDKELIKQASNLAKYGDELIILGDLKHIGKKGRIKEFVEIFDKEITLVKGNHDVKINVNINIESSRGIRIGKYGLFHGHAFPSDDVLQAKKLIFAHAHPSILLTDEVGGLKERVWLEGKAEIDGEKKELLVMPAFNEMCASTAINVEKPAGVIFRKWNYKKSNAILLDGTLVSLESLIEIS
ncbi:MAG: metallophosphoesterase [Archaeoglobaceae archaeon]|nr:metallophosphoesterase [Archaeoglobaceae archaeon]